MTLKTFGGERLGEVVEHSCALARRLADRIDATPGLQRLAPVAMNIVCFRVTEGAEDLDRLNGDIVADLQEAGIAAPSTTRIGGRLAIRAAIVNHRTDETDVDALVDGVMSSAAARSALVRV
jgi:glutamate/tyrosine decarboxylase-like PLP-dependent enzyme